MRGLAWRFGVLIGVERLSNLFSIHYLYKLIEARRAYVVGI
jgi:hypothetical protein